MSPPVGRGWGREIIGHLSPLPGYRAAPTPPNAVDVLGVQERGEWQVLSLCGILHFLWFLVARSESWGREGERKHQFMHKLGSGPR